MENDKKVHQNYITVLCKVNEKLKNT